MHSTGDAGGRRPGAGAIAALVLLYAVEVGCADYKQMRGATYSIWDIRVTTNPEDVAKCRLLGGVDSRDTARGCGLTVWPTPEECLRYQVRMAGGDTLLINGPIGKAYACSTESPSETRPAAETPSTAAPPAGPAPEPAAPTPETPAPPAPAPAPPSAEPRPQERVRITSDREQAKGCVYLGDVVSPGACAGEQGEPSAACADEALKAGGDLVLVEGARAQIFSCKARP